MKKLLLLFAALLFASCGEKSSDSVTLPLSDADVERLLKEAVDGDTLERREGLVYQPNESEPYSGWAKVMYDSGQVGGLAKVKDGIWDGPFTNWHDNGQKAREVTYKDGIPDGPYTKWHENGQKEWEATFKYGEKVSGKYWNSKGEEVESLDAGSVNPNLKYKMKGRSGELIITGAASDRLDRTALEQLQKASGALVIPPLIEGEWVTSIGDYAFYQCRNLTSITIPDSVTSIGGEAFSSCVSLTSITIPDSVTSIGGSAFKYCQTLTSITIPDSVTSIDHAAFFRCTSLTSITIGDSVTGIGKLAFRDCTSLKSITFFGDAPKVAKDAFEGSSPTIYRKPEAKGWGETFGGRPVKLISEKP